MYTVTIEYLRGSHESDEKTAVVTVHHPAGDYRRSREYYAVLKFDNANYGLFPAQGEVGFLTSHGG